MGIDSVIVGGSRVAGLREDLDSSPDEGEPGSLLGEAPRSYGVAGGLAVTLSHFRPELPRAIAT